MARITVKYDVTKIIEETIEVPFDETYIENNEFESIEELRETKKEVIIYLRSILRNIKKYIDNKKYSLQNA